MIYIIDLIRILAISYFDNSIRNNLFVSHIQSLYKGGII